MINESVMTSNNLPEKCVMGISNETFKKNPEQSLMMALRNDPTEIVIETSILNDSDLPLINKAIQTGYAVTIVNKKSQHSNVTSWY
jgi:hypothetical protein